MKPPVELNVAGITITCKQSKLKQGVITKPSSSSKGITNKGGEYSYPTKPQYHHCYHHCSVCGEEADYTGFHSNFYICCTLPQTSSQSSSLWGGQMHNRVRCSEVQDVLVRLIVSHNPPGLHFKHHSPNLTTSLRRLNHLILIDQQLILTDYQSI